jgi:dienelactone hydrolase
MKRCSSATCALALALSGCATPAVPSDTDATEDGDSSGDSGGAQPIDYAVAGPHPVGNTTSSLTTTGGRTLSVEVWYPADPSAREEAEAGQPLSAFGIDDAQSVLLADLVADAPAGCPRTQTGSAASPPAVPDLAALELVVFSHCHSCTRFSSFSVAERLASHGFVVVAADHVEGTLFEELAGNPGPIDAALLTTRSEDVSAVIDAALDPNSQLLPADLRGRIDDDKIGVFGHSFGAATTGRMLQDDDRILAGVAMAAPIESPLIPGVAVDAVDEPLLYLLATEDNSITQVGNNLIEDNYMRASNPVWLARLTDAGHWSVSDLVGLIDLFMPGCGDDMRQTIPTESFTYLDPQLGREIAQHLTASFFALHLRGDQEAREQLESPAHGDHVRVNSRNAD